MKKYFVIILLSIGIAFQACRQDENPDSQFVDPFEIHLVYSMLGESQAFTYPFQITLVNNTDQFTYTRTTDLWGKISLEGLMPGEYTVNIVGEFTAEEVELVTGETTQKGASVVGFLSGITLKIGMANYINNIELSIINAGAIIFKELYYAGSRTPSNGTYRNDNFYSVYNNSLDPVSINNLYIGMVENFGGIGATGPLWPGEEPGNYAHVYLKHAWKVVPGTEPVFLQPGQTIVIATMAAPHNKDMKYNLNSPVDLSNADYEAYCTDPKNTYPDFAAPNMTLAFWPDYAFLWRMGVFGQGMVLIEATPEEFEGFSVVPLPETFQDPFENEEYWLCKQVPLSYVIDAVDLIQNATVTNTKRFPPTLDAGFATVSGTYLSASVIRKLKTVFDGITIYQDTNNSTEDFEINNAPLSK